MFTNFVPHAIITLDRFSLNRVPVKIFIAVTLNYFWWNFIKQGVDRKNLICHFWQWEEGTDSDDEVLVGICKYLLVSNPRPVTESEPKKIPEKPIYQN